MQCKIRDELEKFRKLKGSSTRQFQEILNPQRSSAANSEERKSKLTSQTVNNSEFGDLNTSNLSSNKEELSSKKQLN